MVGVSIMGRGSKGDEKYPLVNPNSNCIPETRHESCRKRRAEHEADADTECARCWEENVRCRGYSSRW